MNVVKNKKIYLTFSGILVIASIVILSVVGLKFGIDFTGGTLWQFKINQVADSALNTTLPVSRSAVEGVLKNDIGISGAFVSQQGEVFLVRLPEISEVEHQAFLITLNEKLGSVEELRFESIGPAISSELRAGSIKVFILVLIAISLYVIFAFRKISYRMPSWKYGVITLATLFHDALIAIGFFALLGYLFGAEVDVGIVVAILVVMGFSVHDTIVVFDRIRENLSTEQKSNLETVINMSVRETLARSINTSITLVVVLIALLMFGADSLNYFVWTILIGTIAGTYSSIFVASPLLTLGRKK
jgi:preprotein translocase subunit SecF